ncbi:hypothetical protein MMC11_003513 [Xylographa trunciseda]|nr:hypothetical protein [Xylographa trunciseda]
MYFPRLILLFAALSSFANCVEAAFYTPTGAVCYNYTIPLAINAEFLVYDSSEWATNNDLTQATIEFVSRIPNKPSPFTATPNNETTKYAIAATFCTPENTSAKHRNTIILASHGLGFDRSYWNIGYEPDKYNFAEFAISQGYSIFFYDRLGVGESERCSFTPDILFVPSPITSGIHPQVFHNTDRLIRISGWVNQVSNQNAILTELATLIRAGKYTGSIGTPQSIALIGHSFGSVISHGVAAFAPNTIDALILTGYNLNDTALNLPLVLQAWAPKIASTETVFTGQDAQLDNGYISWPDVYANINTFFKAPNYDFAAAVYSEATKRPFGYLELLTASTVFSFPTPKFTGPVLLISGENDFIFCDGYCTDVIDDPSSEIFSASKNFKAYIQPGTGHGMNFHKNATGYFGVVTGFLAENGL